MLYRWRTKIDGAVYCHRDVGDDLSGDGSEINPFQSLRKCLSLSPTVIVCYGTFTEDMADGNHARTIRGDYYGAATFDGDDQFLIYGYTHINFIIRNCIVGNSQLNVNVGSGLLAGAGRAGFAGSVGNAVNVYGVAGSPVFLERTGLYWGVIGGITAVDNNVYSKIRANETYPISLGFRSSDHDNLTVYDCPITSRQKRITSYSGTFRYCIFAKFDFFVDDEGVDFSSCFFTSDCNFYYDGNEISITGSTSADRENSLISGMDALSVPAEVRSVFTNCIFSSQTSQEIFNNAEKSDFTIKPGSDADLDIKVGAMPVALNIPILDNSNGVSGSWDENTSSGCIQVLGDVIRIDEYSADSSGSILSKVIEINPLTTNINSIFAMFASKFESLFSRLNRNNPIAATYLENEILPVGTYVVEGGVTIDSEEYGDNSIVNISSTGLSFSNLVAGSKMHLVTEYNYDVLYIRESSKVTTWITSSDNLEQGGIYLNDGNEDITYDARVVAPGESFMAKNNINTFSATSNYTIAVMFDDSRAASVPWIPAQMYGEYFTWRDGLDVRNDDRGIPISSGNDLSYQSVADGGYSDILVKHPLTKRFFQLGIFLKRFRA